MKKIIGILAGSMVVIGGLSSSLCAQKLDDGFTISASGILAAKLKLTLIALNVANSTTMEDENTGLPFQKRYAVLEPDAGGVRVVRIEKSKLPFAKNYDASVPQANSEGFNSYPNINLPDEMVNLAYTETYFEANSTAFKSTKQMVNNALDLLK